ncbi:MAG: hypothetical protein J6Q65_03145 [Lentisphaeria bacterium]|nr:hypothetical protein [Lentisphaeria bacterium]
MIQYLYLIFLTLLALAAEALLRSAGFYLPLTAFAVFYAACIGGILPGVAFALVAGFLLDSFFGYSFTISALLYLLILPIVWGLKDQYVEPGSVLIQMAVGAILVLLVLLPPIPVQGGWRVTLDLLPMLFLSSLFSALLLPLYIIWADHVAERLVLRTYAVDFRQRRRQHG